MLRGRTTKIDYPYYPFRLSVDYVLVSRKDNLSKQLHRCIFEKAIRREGLLVHHDFVGPITFTLISTPFHRLCREAEKLQLAFPLKNCSVDNIEPSCCQLLSWIFVTREREHLVSAPFQRKFANLFTNYTEEPKFFTHAQREMLTHQVLSKIDISEDIERNATSVESESNGEDEPLRRRGLEFLLMEEAYESAFVLHQPSEEEPYFKAMKEEQMVGFDQIMENDEEDSRLNISIRWTNWWKLQPLGAIRDYFGEQIAFYFAWQGTFLTLLWPAAIAGIAVFVFGFFKSVQRSETGFGNCTATSPSDSHSTACNSAFSRFSSWFLRAFDNEMNAVFAAFMSIWGSLFYQIWRRNNAGLAFAWDCEDVQEVEPDRPEYSGTRVREDPITGETVWINPTFIQNIKLLLSAIVVGLCMGVVVCSVFIVTVYKMWAAELFDCNKAQATLLCSISVTYLPSILNTVSTMILGTVYAWIVEKLNQWENHRTHSEYHNALIIKLFAFQLVNNYTSLFYVAFIRPESHGFQQNGLFGLGPTYRDTCSDSTCGSLLAVQLLSHMLLKPVPKFAKDIVIPWFYREYREATWLKRMPTSLNDLLSESDATSVLVREWMKPDAGQFAFWEFNEKILLFGTTMMFAALFPLAPVIALLIGLADLRLDASRLLWFNRKPVPAIASGIGIWLPILSFLQYTAVMTNAFIIAFTSDFCTNFTGKTCDIQSRLLIVIVFQNLVFVLKYLIQSVIPTVPSSIRLAQRRQRFVVSHIIDKGDVPLGVRTRKRTRKAKLAWVTSRIGVGGDPSRLEKRVLEDQSQ